MLCLKRKRGDCAPPDQLLVEVPEDDDQPCSSTSAQVPLSNPPSQKKRRLYRKVKTIRTSAVPEKCPIFEIVSDGKKRKRLQRTNFSDENVNSQQDIKGENSSKRRRARIKDNKGEAWKREQERKRREQDMLSWALSEEVEGLINDYVSKLDIKKKYNDSDGKGRPKFTPNVSRSTEDGGNFSSSGTTSKKHSEEGEWEYEYYENDETVTEEDVNSMGFKVETFAARMEDLLILEYDEEDCQKDECDYDPNSEEFDYGDTEDEDDPEGNKPKQRYLEVDQDGEWDLDEQLTPMERKARELEGGLQPVYDPDTGHFKVVASQRTGHDARDIIGKLIENSDSSHNELSSDDNDDFMNSEEDEGERKLRGWW